LRRREFVRLLGGPSVTCHSRHASQRDQGQQYYERKGAQGNVLLGTQADSDESGERFNPKNRGRGSN
jgi:hypothetical protein